MNYINIVIYPTELSIRTEGGWGFIGRDKDKIVLSKPNELREALALYGRLTHEVERCPQTGTPLGVGTLVGLVRYVQETVKQGVASMDECVTALRSFSEKVSTTGDYRINNDSRGSATGANSIWNTFMSKKLLPPLLSIIHQHGDFAVRAKVPYRPASPDSDYLQESTPEYIGKAKINITPSPPHSPPCQRRNS